MFEQAFKNIDDVLRKEAGFKLRGETQSLASLYERKLSALDALKKSLVRQAITGGL